MRLLAALVLSAAFVCPLAVQAQDTTVIEKNTTTTIPAPSLAPDVSVRTETETTGTVEPCRSKTVHKEDSAGNSETKTKTNC
jgi:hypothetical protein